MDVKQEFIQGGLEFNVFVKLPTGCGDQSGKVVKLYLRSMYGAGRRWAILLRDVSVSKVGMEQCSKADPCIFRLIRDDKVVMILLLLECLTRANF